MNFGQQQQTAIPLLLEKGIEKWKPYERSQQILWSLISNFYDRSQAIFFWWILYIFWVLNYGTKTVAEATPIIAWGTELEKWKPNERSQQIWWSLINDIFILWSLIVILWSLIRIIYISLIAHTGFLWPLMWNFFGWFFIFWVLNFGTKQQQRDLPLRLEEQNWKSENLMSSHNKDYDHS